MCRMIGVSSGEPVEVMPYFEAVRDMARSGKRAPHGDGWGVAYLDGDEIKLIRHTEPIWESDPEELEGVYSDLFIIHARKASIGAVEMENIHPFRENGYAFAHNGTEKARLRLLSGVRVRGDTDSERIFLHLLKQKEDSNFAVAYRALLEKGLRNLTSLLMDAETETLHAFRCTERLPGYYTLYYGVSHGLAVVSSEPIGFCSEPVEMGEMVTFSRGELVEKKIIGSECLLSR